jgi:hypothetical protein
LFREPLHGSGGNSRPCRAGPRGTAAGAAGAGCRTLVDGASLAVASSEPAGSTANRTTLAWWEAWHGSSSLECSCRRRWNSPGVGRGTTWMDRTGSTVGLQAARQGRIYSPYELSDALLSGSWVFPPGEWVRALYRDMAQEVPLSPDIMKVYVGPSAVGAQGSAQLHPG